MSSIFKELNLFRPTSILHIIKKRFTIATTLIFVLAIVNFLLYTYTIQHNQVVDNLISYVAQERTYILEASYTAYHITEVKNAEKDALEKRLLFLGNEIQKRHEFLTTAQSRETDQIKDVVRLYRDDKIKLNDQVTTFLMAVQKFAKAPSRLQTKQNPQFRYMLESLSKGKLFTDLNEFVEKCRATRVKNSKILLWVNISAFSGILLMLIFLYYTIFEPLYSKIQSYTQEIEDVNVKLANELMERQRVESELLDSEALFRNLANNAPIAIWLTSASSEFKFLNKYWLDYTGQPLETQLGYQWSNSLHPDDVDVSINIYQKAFKQKQPFMMDYRLRRFDGVFEWFQVNAIPHFDPENNKFQGYIGTSVNIAERKRYEANIKQITIQLAQANKELQDFSVIASHDLQEPLRKIVAFNERIQSLSNGNLNPEARQYMTRVQNTIHRMQNLINALLQYSRVTTRAQESVPVDLNKLLQDLISDLDLRIQDTQATVEILTPLPIIEGEPTQLYQLFQNLLTNSLKYAQRDVPPIIRISAGSVESPERVGMDLHADAVLEFFTQIKIEDNGIGFDGKYAQKIFSPFQRLHGRNEYEGTGMGLAICHKITERHYGKIYAESESGTGSRFYLVLPLKQVSQEEAAYA